MFVKTFSTKRKHGGIDRDPQKKILMVNDRKSTQGIRALRKMAESPQSPQKGLRTPRKRVTFSLDAVAKDLKSAPDDDGARPQHFAEMPKHKNMSAKRFLRYERERAILMDRHGAAGDSGVDEGTVMAAPTDQASPGSEADSSRTAVAPGIQAEADTPAPPQDPVMTPVTVAGAASSTLAEEPKAPATDESDKA